MPTSKGYKGYPGRDLHLAERHGRARDPGRRYADRRATSSRSTSASPRTASSPTRPGRSRSARSRPRRSGCSTSAGPLSRPGSSRRGSATSIGGHLARPSRRSPRTPGFSVDPEPRRPRRRQLDPRGAAGAELRLRLPRPGAREGMTIAIEPMITAGGPEVYTPRRRAGRSRPDGSLAPTSSTPSRSPRRARAIAHEREQGVLVP